jgi:hypothetical protein
MIISLLVCSATFFYGYLCYFCFESLDFNEKLSYVHITVQRLFNLNIDLYIVHWQGTVYCTFWWCSISEHTIEFSSWLLWFLWLEEWLFVIKICSIDLACWYSRVQWNCFDQHTTQHCWAAFCKVTMEKLNITNVRLINWDKMSLNGNV